MTIAIERAISAGQGLPEADDPGVLRVCLAVRAEFGGGLGRCTGVPDDGLAISGILGELGQLSQSGASWPDNRNAGGQRCAAQLSVRRRIGLRVSRIASRMIA